MPWGLVSKAKKICTAAVDTMICRQIRDKMVKHCVKIEINPKYKARWICQSVSEFLKLEIAHDGAWKRR